MEQFLTNHEIIVAARRNAVGSTWDYICGGSETETTMRRNRQALDSIAFRPRVLRDVSKIDCSGTLFGKRLRIPVVFAPVGSIEVFDEGGAGTACKAAARFGNAAFVSSVSQPGLEGAAEAGAGGRTPFQLYVRGDPAWVDDHARRAIAARYHALCLPIHPPGHTRPAPARADPGRAAAGPFGADRDEIDTPDGPVDVSEFWRQARRLSIFAGTSEIQRNVIAKRILGLP